MQTALFLASLREIRGKATSLLLSSHSEGRMRLIPPEGANSARPFIAMPLVDRSCLEGFNRLGISLAPLTIKKNIRYVTPRSPLIASRPRALPVRDLIGKTHEVPEHERATRDWDGAALVACGSDSGNGTSTGIFVDSPVDGLHFTTSSNPMGGFTSGGGHFECQAGDTVMFFIGTRQIGNPQPCPSEIVTAVSVLGASSVSAPEVINLAQLLMTLATSVTPALMTLPQTLPPEFNSPLVPAFTDPNFDTAVVAALPTGTSLVPEATATTQLQTSLKMLTVIDNGGTVTSTPRGSTVTLGWEPVPLSFRRIP